MICYFGKDSWHCNKLWFLHKEVTDLLQQDTIAALVTAVGESSVGIIRLSGPEAVAVAAKIYKGKADLQQADSHTIQYGYVYDWKQNKKIDEALF